MLILNMTKNINKNFSVYTIVTFEDDYKEAKNSGTFKELYDLFIPLLKKAADHQNDPGCHKIDLTPLNIKSLVNNLNYSEINLTEAGYAKKFYFVGWREKIFT